MRRATVILGMLAVACTPSNCSAARENEPETLAPLTARVNVQAEVAAPDQIIDGEWVAVGTKAAHAIRHDHTRPFDGKPSYRFELRDDDNTLEGYNEGETKGRAELSYCYATAADFAPMPAGTYADAQKTKTVYHYGKGITPQGASRTYRFSVRIPRELDPEVHTIFAQWHGMPDRTLVQTPEGEIKKLTLPEFMELWDGTIFKKNVGHEKIMRTDKNGSPKKDADGNILYEAGEPNGWLVEQGGYPPMAFGFNGGYFYIKTNSDRKWLTNKDDRTNADVERSEIMVSKTSDYKVSTVAYKSPMTGFPRETWVTFDVRVDWSRYGGVCETVTPGRLDVKMSYEQNGKPVARHIVDDESIYIGRNDDDGYYFKFGIYRTAGSTVPVYYNLAGYSEQ